jgi:hypothetical protein
MDARKAWLTQLAASPSVQDWALACAPATFDGTARVQTRNTTYLFRNGSCFAVTSSDPDRGTTPDFVGMKLVGWLVTDYPQLHLTRVWRTGVCAVLWGVPGRAGLPVALTSPTQRFARFTSTGPQDPTGRPSVDFTPDLTFTRINLPMRQRIESSLRPFARAV